MNSTGLMRTSLFCLLGAGLTTACVTDKELGDLEEDTESGTTEGDPGSSSNETDTASTSGTTVDPSATTDPTLPTTATVTTADPTLPTTATVTTADPTMGTDPSGTEGDTESDTEGASICADWAAPPFDCEGPGSATLEVDWDGGGPNVDDAMCTVTALSDMGGGGEQLTLQCGGDEYNFFITTASPQVSLPLTVAMDVRLSLTNFRRNVLNAPTFIIRDLAGDLLVAYVNQIGLDIPDGLDPLSLVVSATGCPGIDIAEKCSGDGSILSQRQSVEFGLGAAAVELFDGSSGLLDTDAVDYSITLGQANDLPCWDDDCFGDDSGPFQRLEFLVTAN